MYEQLATVKRKMHLLHDLNSFQNTI